jgi:hypothetical protein
MPFNYCIAIGQFETRLSSFINLLLVMQIRFCQKKNTSVNTETEIETRWKSGKKRTRCSVCSFFRLSRKSFKYLKKANFLILSSKMMPNVILESLACQTIVSFNCLSGPAAIFRIFGRKKIKFLKLTEAMNEMVTDDSLYRYVLRMQQKVLNHFYEVIGQQWLDFDEN